MMIFGSGISTKPEPMEPSGPASLMGNKWWLYGLGATATLGILSALTARRYRKPEELIIAYGARPHVMNEFGIVEADPMSLAIAAQVPLDQYVLASAMQSEERRDRARLAIGRAIWNKVKEDRSRLVSLLIPTSKLGAQTINPYAATGHAPTQRTLALAASILEGRVPDFVEGATQWDAPKTQDALYQRFLSDPVRYRKHRFNSEDIAKRRRAAGAREVRLADVPNTRFWTYQTA